jgi:hypothetical protein
MANKNETKSADVTKAANPVPTFNVNDPLFQKFVQQAVEAKMAAMAAERPAKSSDGKSQRSLANETATIRAFRKKLGITVKPREDVKSFRLWALDGYRPVEGTKAIKVNSLRLFHRSQVRPLSKEEKQKMLDDQKQAIDRAVAKEASKVVPLTTA